MQVKGTALRTTRDFVKTRFPEFFEKWLNSLSPESKKIYSATIDATAWYPYKEAYALPVEKIMELCYRGDRKTGGDELGNWSAEVSLKGFYKVFLLIASPQFLLQRASKIFTTFYEPSEIEASITGSNDAILRIIKFDHIDESIEYRIAGWIRKALELANCNSPRYEIKKFLSKGDDSTEIFFHWQ
ncbi:MAG TPA: hypothetical protein VHI78_04380 [Bacteroidales bacterium]|jgi:hypothetical protein|nr:hypothetical protein [Bacteroidales bacterium]